MMPSLRKGDKICLICVSRFWKTGNDSGEIATRGQPGRKSDSELYTQFLHFTGRYLQLKTTSESLLKELTEYKNEVGGEGDFEPFCGSCRALVTHVCDLYSELEFVKLRLVWKLSQLGGNLKQSKAVTSCKLGRGLFNSMAKQLHIKSGGRLEMFRKALEIKCINKEKSCSPKTVIPRGLIPESYRYPLPATKTMLTHLIVVYLLGSTSMYTTKSDILQIQREQEPDIDVLKVTRRKKKLSNDRQAVWEGGYGRAEEKDNCSVNDNDNNFNNENSGSDCSKEAASPSPASSAFSDSEVGLSQDEDADTARRPKRKLEASKMKVEFRNEKEDSVDSEGDGSEPDGDDDEENQSGAKRAKLIEFKAIARKVRKLRKAEDKPKSLACSKCSRTFADFRALSTHFRHIHRSHIEFTCKLCGLNFKGPSYLSKHTKSVHGKVSGLSSQSRLSKGIPTTCTSCNEEFPSQIAMMRHRQIVHLHGYQKKFECPICFRLVPNEDHFQIHLLSHENLSFKTPTPTSPIVTFHCQVCGEGYDEQNSLQKHMEEIHQGTFHCDCCDAKHASGSLLLEHLQTHERKEKEKPLQCDLCRQRFSTQQYFNIHQKLAHLDNARMSCDKLGCSERFVSVQELNEHLKLHVRGTSAQESKELQVSNVPISSEGKMKKSKTGPERIVLNCSICNRGYLSKYDLLLHDLVHMPHSEIGGDIGYNCPRCRHRARSLETLIVHYHTCLRGNNKGVACSICDKMFPSAIFLKAHLQAHQDERAASGELLPCGIGICEMKYADEVWLRVHRSTHAQSAKELVPKFSSKCTVCEQDFKLISFLRDHLESMHETEDKYFHCWFCPRQFTVKQTLEGHRFSQHEYHKFCCEDAGCGKEFQTPEGLENHLRKEHVTEGSMDGDERRTKTIIHCQKCSWSFMNPDLLELHEVVHADVSGTFKCPKCVISFSTFQSLRFHYDKLHIQFIRRYECPECGLELRARSSYINHIRSQHKKRKKEVGPDLLCDQCDYRTNDISILQKHVNNCHSEWKSCSFEGCSKKFKNSMYLARHINRCHEVDNKKTPCPICGLKYVDLAAVRAHLKDAHVDRNFVCDICGKAFKQERNLQHHKECLHSDNNKKEYICSDCGMAYKSYSGLLAHNGSVHTPESEKKFGCPHCSKRYSMRHLLHWHIKTCRKNNDRESAEEYVCSDCGMVYRSNSGLKAHIGSVHTPESEKKFGCPHCLKRYHRRNLLDWHLKKTCKKINGVVTAGSEVKVDNLANATASQETNSKQTVWPKLPGKEKKKKEKVKKIKTKCIITTSRKEELIKNNKNNTLIYRIQIY